MRSSFVARRPVAAAPSSRRAFGRLTPHECSARLQQQIAEAIRALPVVQDVAAGGADQASQRWHDTRPWLDLRERAPLAVDEARLWLDYALDAGLVVRHAQQQHLVRLARRPASG